MRYAISVVALLLAITPAAANNYTITFSGLVGANGVAMPNSYVENGFSVTPISGNWKEAHLFGNPVPDIFADFTVSTIEVARTNAVTFTFTSVDLADAVNGGARYDLQGFLGAASVFSVSGGPLPGGFVTIPSPSAAPITRLQITMHKDLASYNIDNIAAANFVPEPNSICLFAMVAFTIYSFRPRIRRQPS